MINTTEILDFGELIKTYRKSKRMTQRQFGVLIGKKQVTISNYEKGVHFPNDVEEIKLIANTINQPVDYVVDSIEFAKKGVIEQRVTPLINLDHFKDENFNSKYKFLVDEKEITNAELEKMIELLRFERFKINQYDNL